MTAPLSGESWGLSEPREPHLLPAVLGLEAQRVRACVCARVHACVCLSQHALPASEHRRAHVGLYTCWNQQASHSCSFTRY